MRLTVQDHKRSHPMLEALVVKLKSFRETLHQFFENRTDATFELAEALSNNTQTKTVVEFSLNPPKQTSMSASKATELWIHQQNRILPATTWQHITFTMPSELWDFFWYHLALLNQIGKIAADCIKNQMLCFRELKDYLINELKEVSDTLYYKMTEDPMPNIILIEQCVIDVSYCVADDGISLENIQK